MTDDCPCKGCTPESGRGPGCHSKWCPHGWYDWNQRHMLRRAAQNAARVADYEQTEITLRRARNHDKQRRSR